MNDELTETVATVAPKLWRSTKEIHSLHKVSIVGQTAISNRLQRLRALRLVECRKVGKEKHWRRV